jgi:hypothetical protein
MKKFVALGTECAKYLKAVRASKGILLVYSAHFEFLYLLLYHTHFSPFSLTTDALVTTNARILSLEAKLNALRKAFDAATAAKVSAEKSTKSALATAKKAEKALTDANKGHLQREQAVAERLNMISAAAGGMYYTFVLFFLSFLLLICLLFCNLLIHSSPAAFYFLDSTEYTKVSMSTLQPDSDPLMAVVSLLEANWISIRKIFELVNRILAQIFVGLWPKQKSEVLDNDIKKLT